MCFIFGDVICGTCGYHLSSIVSSKPSGEIGPNKFVAAENVPSSTGESSKDSEGCLSIFSRVCDGFVLHHLYSFFL
ncbi:unnamed protein product [Victoria cruziana]